jgi:hypothetical protein
MCHLLHSRCWHATWMADVKAALHEDFQGFGFIPSLVWWYDFLKKSNNQVTICLGLRRKNIEWTWQRRSYDGIGEIWSTLFIIFRQNSCLLETELNRRCERTEHRRRSLVLRSKSRRLARVRWNAKDSIWKQLWLCQWWEICFHYSMSLTDKVWKVWLGKLIVWWRKLGLLAKKHILRDLKHFWWGYWDGFQMDWKFSRDIGSTDAFD